MPVSESSRPWLWLWGKIQSGVAVRASTGDLWAEINGALDEAGTTNRQGLWQAVNEMRSISAGMRNGAERFAKADRSDPFSPLMAAPDINVRDPATRAIMPEYLVRYDLKYTDRNGDTQTRQVTMRAIWRPDMTVGDVLDDLADSADGMANDYGQGLIGWSNPQPVSI